MASAGSVRTYVHLDQPFTYERWIEGAKAGRTFVTTGPMLTFSVDGREAGETIALNEAGTVTVHATVRSMLPVERLEVVRGGEVVRVQENPDSLRNLTLETTIDVEGSTWIAVRAASSRQMPTNGVPLADADQRGPPPGTLQPGVRLRGRGVNEANPSISPNGRFVAYNSDETGKPEVWVASRDSPEMRLQVSLDTGFLPKWGKNGSELYYVTSDLQMMTAVFAANGFAVERRQRLSSIAQLNLRPNYDVTRDGERFLMIKERQRSAPGDVVLFQNFFELLNERVGN